MGKFITKKSTGQELVRKELHIPIEVFKKYKLLVAATDKSIKEYLEDILITHIQPKKK